MKYKWYLTLMLTGLILTGCGATELEERCFPMLVAVGYDDRKVTYEVAYPKDGGILQFNTKADDFKTSKEEYESRLNKETDYNHLKVLVFDEDFLEHSQEYGAMLDYLAETENFPRNTYVCGVDDIEDLMELEKEVSEDMGSYLEEYLKQHEERKDKLLTLGDLIDEKDNAEIVLYLPYLEIEENYIEWKGYVNTKGKIWKES